MAKKEVRKGWREKRGEQCAQMCDCVLAIVRFVEFQYRVQERFRRCLGPEKSYLTSFFSLFSLVFFTLT